MSFVSTETQTAPSIVICLGDNSFSNTFHMEVNANGVECGGFDTRRLPELLVEFGSECDLYYALLVLIESCIGELAPTLPTAAAYVPRATAGCDSLEEDVSGYFLNELDGATLVQATNEALGFARAESLPIWRWPGEMQVRQDLNVMQMLSGYMAALPLPYVHNGEWLHIDCDYPEDGFMQPEYFPYAYYNNNLYVERTITAHGWACPVRLPYEVRQGCLVVIARQVGFDEAVALPYEYAEGIGLVVTRADSLFGFAPAEQLNQVTVYGYSTNVLHVLGCETPGDELVFGLELETSDDNCDIYPLAATRKGIWKEDSSCGLEFVTKPMPIEELLEFAHKAPVGTLSPDSSCGMHLHINRRALSQRQICLLALLISSEEYAEQIDQIAGRRSNDFCKKVKKTEDEVLHTRDRYEAVNLTNYSESKYTVEIRIFAGTRYNHHLVERVLWVYQLVQFVKSPFASADYGDFLKYQAKLSGFIKHLAK